MGDVATQRRLSQARFAARPRLTYGALLGAVAVVYFAVAKLGLVFAADHELVVAVWAPAGLALAAVVVLGYRIWPAIAVGALVTDATGDSSLATSAGLATADTLAALGGGYMLALAGFDPALRRVRDVVALAGFGAVLSTALDATIGVSTLWASGAVDLDGLWGLWRVWWLGDLTGVLLVAPAVLVAAGARPRRPRAARVAEAGALGFLAVAITLLALDEDIVVAYPAFPLIVLAAMRFRQPGAVLAAWVVSALAIAFTADGSGPFAGGSTDDELLRSQAFVALAAITGLLVAAMRSEWERAEHTARRLAEGERALADAQRLARIGSWEWDIAADGVRLSDELHRILGVAPEAFDASYAGILALVHPDDLVILCEDLVSEAAAIRIAERITEAFQRPFVLEGSEHHLSISVGVVFVEGGQAAAAEVLRNADVAMYRAKGRGKGRFELFDAQMRSRVLERLSIEADLRQAIHEDSLRLAYQPVLSLDTAEFVAAEALLRWQHPERGLLTPPDFIDVAEESGLIVPVGAWVIREACRNAAAWSQARPEASPLAVSINLSPRQVSDWNFVDLVHDAIEETKVDPDLVELEITETALVDNAETALVTLGRLKEMGVRLVLDDFGTGHASISRLKRFPIDALKVDREFIAGLGDEGEEEAIVSAVLSMARALDVEVIAEGVETTAQLEWLADSGWRFVQGYLLSRPLTVGQLEALGSWPGSAGSAGDAGSPMPVVEPLG